MGPLVSKIHPTVIYLVQMCIYTLCIIDTIGIWSNLTVDAWRVELSSVKGLVERSKTAPSWPRVKIKMISLFTTIPAQNSILIYSLGGRGVESEVPLGLTHCGSTEKSLWNSAGQSTWVFLIPPYPIITTNSLGRVWLPEAETTLDQSEGWVSPQCGKSSRPSEVLAKGEG